MQTQDTRQARNFFAQKLAFTTGPFELDGMLKRGEDITILDVRLPSDYRQAHIPGAINLPKGKWHTLNGLNKDRTTVIYCYNQQCKLAAEAAVELASHGYPVIEMEGGFDAWVAAELPTESSQA
jgi:rhodanese-related sulfurtransferase